MQQSTVNTTPPVLVYTQYDNQVNKALQVSKDDESEGGGAQKVIIDFKLLILHVHYYNIPTCIARQHPFNATKPKATPNCKADPACRIHT